MFENLLTGQSSAPNEEESIISKLNWMVEVMEKNNKSMKDRMSFLEKENLELKARVSELEGMQNVASRETLFHEAAPQTNVTEQQATIEWDTFISNVSGTPLSPMSQQTETQFFSPNVAQQIEQEPLMNETLDAQTQVLSPNVTQQKETEQSLDGTPSNPNRAEENLEDEIEKEPSNETPPAPTQFFSTNETTVKSSEKLKPLNDESPPSPASQQIETQVFSPNPTQHIKQEPLSNETPDAQTTTNPLTELISLIAGQYKNSDDETQTGTQVLPSNVTQRENTQVVANTPASPNSSLMLDENQNATVNETQPLSDETQSKQNQEGENPADEDTTEPLTEIISTSISETMPLSKQTQPLTKTSPIHFSETKKAEESRRPTLFEIGADVEVEIASTGDTTCRIWYPAKVVDLNGVEKVTVEYYCTLLAEKKRVQNTITTDKIRPAPPTSDQKAFEMSVNFEPSHLRIHREWIDGVWKMADEMQTGYFKGPEMQSKDLSQQDH
ncbi:hypothetical protein Bca4012_020195 [Brassica carinata]